MRIVLDKERQSLQQQLERFARAKTPTDLNKSNIFPEALWSEMRKAGLFGLGLPERHGGLGGDWRSIQVATEAFTLGTRNMGVALSWLIHLIVCRFAIFGFGSERQLGQWLRLLAEGEKTVSLAISEPGTGAHPKHMRTAALRSGEDWILTGEKSFVTNGPLAGLFVILAVTEKDGDRKRMSAFLVPRETSGLRLTDPLSLDYLKPALHCGIRLENCRISSDCLLGQSGTAFERISKPFRDLEDVMLMGPVLGGMQLQISALPGLITERGIQRDDSLKTAVGELQYRLDTLKVLAYEAATLLEGDRDRPELTSLILSFRSLAGQFQSCLAQLIDQTGIHETPEWKALAKDLSMTIRIAGHVALIKQRKIGEATLLKERMLQE